MVDLFFSPPAKTSEGYGTTLVNLARRSTFAITSAVNETDEDLVFFSEQCFNIFTSFSWPKIKDISILIAS